MIAGSLLCGALVGLSLGLTGGGGTIFAVPLLVYGLGMPMSEAVTISLAAVGTTAMVGFLRRWQLGQVELRTGVLFAAAGMVGAPLGTWLAEFVPEPLRLMLFAGLMGIIAGKLWTQASRVPAKAGNPLADHTDGPTCRRDAAGTLRLTSRCAFLLVAVGVVTGVVTGLFGVGGGFVIVPALVLFSGMSMYRAVGTSLLVITLVSVAGVVSQFGVGQSLQWDVAGLFVLGGIAGLFAGQQLARRLSGPALQKAFSVAILVVAGYVLWRSIGA